MVKRGRLASGWGGLVVLASLLSGCSDDADEESAEQKALSATTDAERGGLCDWTYQLLGGYGFMLSCPGGLVEGAANQAACASELAPKFNRCGASVAQFKSCQQRRAVDLCDFEVIRSAPECQAFSACL